MGKREKNIIAKRLVHSYLSSIISIALVLLLVGIFGILAANAGAVQNYFRENVKISAILKENVPDLHAKKLQRQLDLHPAIKKTTFISKEQGTEEMRRLLGEDFLEAFESNPIPVSIELNLKGEYFHPDSIGAIKESLLKNPQIEEVAYQESLLEVLNNNLEKIAMAFLVFIVLLMFISFVLINNTVRLNIYSKRFSIYTMRLVGAKRSFIRAPFLVKSLFQGILSGLLAALALVGILYLLRNEFRQIFSIFQMELIAAVLGGVVVLGALICLVCTFFVVNRMVSLTNDELYY
ncbi:MAG: permease-like cell division protein FtsX [Bacteroidales bacterium]|nr:permease-like cell division protein FtsX [Bacteroidales bacterium]MBR2437760.1 permease-like cell division protein FtsX [Bacteroidales bacterium]